MARLTTPLLALALLLAACNDKGAAAPKTDKPATGSADKPVASACDVTVKTGADAPAVDLEEGKTYCVGEHKLTRATKIDEARKLLSDCAADEALEGETRVQCKGVRLSFGGPTLVLSRFQPTP